MSQPGRKRSSPGGTRGNDPPSQRGRDTGRARAAPAPEAALGPPPHVLAIFAQGKTQSISLKGTENKPELIKEKIKRKTGLEYRGEQLISVEPGCTHVIYLRKKDSQYPSSSSSSSSSSS